MAIANGTDLRPPLAFRVGVSGHRRLEPEATPSLSLMITQALQRVRDELEACARSPGTHSAYSDISAASRARLRVVSPLAEGADRLVARAAVALEAELYAPLPFAREDYEKDFPDSVTEFRALIGRARVFTLDGLRDGGAGQTESYEAVGRFVVRNCDLLIAIWDGKRVRGQGGTGDIVRYAIGVGVPVLWIAADGAGAPKILRNALDYHSPDRAPNGEAAWSDLTKLVAHAVAPPSAPAPIRAGAFGWVAQAIRRGLHPDLPPLQEFLTERPPRRGFPWRSHATLLSWVSKHSQADVPALEPATSDAELYWRARFEFADDVSGGYGDRYRSSYVLIAFLAVLALAFAAIAGEAHGLMAHGVIIGVELGALLGIGGLVTANHAFRWHERWISYRLLAELCRKQYVLASLGRALPGSYVARLNYDVEDPALISREEWVAWYFMASLRGAAFPEGDMASAKTRALAIARSLVAEQIAYHQSRMRDMRSAGDRISTLAEVFFALSVLVAAVKLFTLTESEGGEFKPAGLLSAFLSAGAGAFVGLRAYAEFSLLTRQSAFMLRMLEAARADMAAVALVSDRPLGSLALGRSLYDTTTAMLQDITGWAHLFRIKTIEAA